MKETIGLIPQVFYDLIGRVFPGSAVLAAGLLIGTDSARIHTIAAQLLDGSGPALSILLVFWLMAAYLVGLLLGAIGFLLFEDGLKNPEFRRIKRQAPADSIEESDLPYIYDFILEKDPSAGLRLAKLRAESHLCRVLVVGCAALATLSLANRNTTLVGIGALVLTAVAAFYLQRHLKVRIWMLTVNCWIILNEGPLTATERNASHPC